MATNNISIRTTRIRLFNDPGFYPELTVVGPDGQTYLRVLGTLPTTDSRWFEQPSGLPVDDKDQHDILNELAGVVEEYS